MDMFPVRVLVERVRPQHCISCSHDGQPVVDTYAIVAGQTVMKKLIESVLNALGMPELIADSRGFIQVNNWKPLTFDTITDNLDEPIGNLLKNIQSNITLKILTKNTDAPSASECIVDLKQKLLTLTIERQPHLFQSSSGRQIRDYIQSLLNSEEMPSLTEEQTQEINEWLDQIAKEEDEENKRRSPNGTTQTRFSQVSEIPRLERWFRADPNPTRQKLNSYMNMLNNSQYRKTNSQVTYQQIANWFTNQRAQQRNTKDSFALLSQQTTSQIPVATMPVDIRTKFSGSNGYNPALSDSERIDGGSESPNGQDDVSEHSISDNDQDVKESFASSPDQMAFDLASSLAGGGNGATGSQSPKRSASPSAVASLNALQAMIPNLANLPLNPSTLSQQFANIFNNTLTNNALAQLSKDLSLGGTPTRGDKEHSSRSESKSNNASSSGTANGHSENQREGSAPGGTPNVARSRLMFDPLSELPILERWFEENPHPGWMQIEQYTDALNGLPYRQSYPPISTHNVKIWFKNRRAKCKRLLTNDGGNKMSGLNQFLHGQIPVKEDLH